MAIPFQCPLCGSQRQVTDKLLGKEIECPDCGKTVTVTETAVTVEAVEAAAPASIAVAVEASTDGMTDEEIQAREERELAAASASFRKPKSDEDNDMDMTPMVDVTFLLLIFFMVTASFSVQKTLQRPATKPDDPSLKQIEQEEQDNPDIVTVQVDEFNAYNVITANGADEMVGSKQDLIRVLNDAMAGGSGVNPSKLVIQAHEDCIHGAVVACLDAGREASFESFEVSTVEEFD